MLISKTALSVFGLIFLSSTLSYSQNHAFDQANSSDELFKQKLDRVLQLQVEQDLLKRQKQVRLLEKEVAELTNQIQNLQGNRINKQVEADYQLVAALLKSSIRTLVIKYLPQNRLISWDTRNDLKLFENTWSFSKINQLGAELVNELGESILILYGAVEI